MNKIEYFLMINTMTESTTSNTVQIQQPPLPPNGLIELARKYCSEAHFIKYSNCNWKRECVQSHLQIHVIGSINRDRVEHMRLFNKIVLECTERYSSDLLIAKASIANRRRYINTIMERIKALENRDLEQFKMLLIIKNWE